MSEDQEENLPAPSTGEDAPEVDSSPTTVDEGTPDSSVPETREDKAAKPSNRESLIASLTGAKAEKDDAEDEEDEAEEAEEPQTEEPEVKEGEEPAGSPHDTSDKRSKAKQRFEVLTSHNKELKAEVDRLTPHAKYGESVLKFCQEAKLSPQKLGVWLPAAAHLETNPAAAEDVLGKLGFKPKTVVQNVKEVPTELEDAVLDLASTGDLTPDGMRKLIGAIRTARTAAPAKPAPTAEETKEKQAPAAPTKVQPFDAPDPAKAEYDAALAKTVVVFDQKDAELAKKYPADWPKLRQTVKDALASKYRGTHPSQWPAFFDTEVELAIAKLKRSAPPTKSQALRPSTQTTAHKPPPTGRAALMAELTGKARKG